MRRLHGGWQVARLTMLAVLTTVAVVATTVGRASQAPTSNEVVLGALLSLSGPWSSLGRASEAALEIAVDDVNQTLLGSSRTRVRLAVEDTRLDPDVALEQLRALASRGVKVVIGPQSSAEVAALKPFADANGLLLISQGSTASLLSMPDDNLFRFVPDDSEEIAALATLLVSDGVRAVVPMWRTDIGNAGLQSSLRRIFPRSGGSVLEGVSYAPEKTELEAEVAALSAQVAQARAASGPDAVAVYLAAFDEVVAIFDLAQRDPVLSTVRWYGSDGVALSEALVGNATAARFAIRAGYPNPILGLDERTRDRWEPLAEQIRARTGSPPDAFGLTAYDAAWVAALTILATGQTGDVATLRTALARIADSYNGVTGPMTLNQAGDRATGNYDFWAIRERGGAYEWSRVARYLAEPGLGDRLVRE